MADVIKRARAFVQKNCPPGISGSNRHAATFYAATVLVNGFALGESDAWPLLCEFNATCQPPSDEKKLRYRLKRAMASCPSSGRGYLLTSGTFHPKGSLKQVQHLAVAPVAPPAPAKTEFDPAALARLAKSWRHIDLVWLANRSFEDPACVSPTRFLELLYDPKEKVKIFTSEMSQGQALWPCDAESVPTTGPLGVWFLAAPVDGKSYVNPRVPPDENGRAKMSSRSEESVTSWRWMVVESDEANTRDWLGVLVQMPLRIAALYTSGGRSVHALIRIDARTKEEWDHLKAKIKPWLVLLGADPGALSAVRLTRLPGCWREGKLVKGHAPGETVYQSLKSQKTPSGVLQKLLYVNPRPQIRPIADVPAVRDVESTWLSAADEGVGDADETGGVWIEQGLSYYASVSAKCADRLARFRMEVQG